MDINFFITPPLYPFKTLHELEVTIIPAGASLVSS